MKRWLRVCKGFFFRRLAAARTGVSAPHWKAPLLAHTPRKKWGTRCWFSLVAEVEGAEQIPDGRAVGRHVGVLLGRFRVWQVVAAASRQRLEVPVTLDE